MTEIDALNQEIAFLEDEIKGLRSRMGNTGNALQKHKLAMLTSRRHRCRNCRPALERRGQAA